LLIPAIIDDRRPNGPAFHFDDATMSIQGNNFVEGSHIDQIGIRGELLTSHCMTLSCQAKRAPLLRSGPQNISQLRGRLPSKNRLTGVGLS
jgi:hypothetical protein